MRPSSGTVDSKSITARRLGPYSRCRVVPCGSAPAASRGVRVSRTARRGAIQAARREPKATPAPGRDALLPGTRLARALEGEGASRGEPRRALTLPASRPKQRSAREESAALKARLLVHDVEPAGARLRDVLLERVQRGSAGANSRVSTAKRPRPQRGSSSSASSLLRGPEQIADLPRRGEREEVRWPNGLVWRAAASQ